MPILAVYDLMGNKIGLKSTGKSGGEGAIYEIIGNDGRCAKIYHPQKITAELHQKVLSMVNNPPDDPSPNTRHRSIGWPEDVLYSDPARRLFVGYTMPLIDTKIFKETHKYFDPSDRLKAFGGSFTWQHLFTAAFNMASAVAALHEKGHRIGDLRETNILVSPSALVSIIDCDSFQVKDSASGITYHTRVGSGEYLPPELMGVDFKTNDYDRYHSDLFALAIIIFKFLANGVHPYQARGPLVEDAPSPEEKIKKGHFPYATDTRGIEPPSYALPYNIIPPSIRVLFYRCFVEGHADPTKRPVAIEWFNALKAEGVKLKQCSQNEYHWYGNHLTDCPWCNISMRLGKDYFPKPFLAGQQIELIAAKHVSQLPQRVPLVQAQPQMYMPTTGGAQTAQQTYVQPRAARKSVRKRFLASKMDGCVAQLFGGALALFSGFKLYQSGVFIYSEFGKAVDDQMLLLNVTIYAIILIVGIHIIRCGIEDW
ncbi:MAG: protein kinase domain-containing protein [Candidatus Aquicultor sp.]